MTERREEFQLMANLKRDGDNLSDIARRTQMNWRTVKKYLTSSLPSIERETRVNYNKYMNQINHMVHLEINPTAMFKSLKDLGLNCCERSFTRWFTIKFSAYQDKWSRAYPQPLKNAISYNWTNGLVEGCVNTLRNKKCEIYGRRGFQLLRRKVCLSVMG
ncbi:hypothetical protein [Pedobacter cryoconitis]|uniref:hypothetical protein n=1 Tax=Pedobacter cryoconitis TaxID=188932 RepID=UPI0016116492|nr:hypothetical protein [Pedobacter cryoconitis]